MEHRDERTRKLSSRSAVLLMLLQGILYGLGDPISKTAFEAMPIYALLSVRYCLGLGVLLLFAGKRILAGLRVSSPRDWLLPSLCMGGAYLINNVALELTAATSVAFLRSLTTVIAPLLALVVYRRRMHWKHIPVQILVVVGLYLLCGGLSGFGAGEGFALLSALLVAGSLVFGEKALERVDPVTLTACQTAISALMATVCAPLLNGGWHLDAITPLVGAIIVYLGAGCTAGGYALQNTALGSISSRTVALLQGVCPVMTALFSRILLGERLSPAGILGAAMILLCLAAEARLTEEHR